MTHDGTTPATCRATCRVDDLAELHIGQLRIQQHQIGQQRRSQCGLRRLAGGEHNLYCASEVVRTDSTMRAVKDRAMRAG